tara:strand:- start:616 stop:1110 length:495 start_codon:yes stop_codon:yes gene_type:complete
MKDSISLIGMAGAGKTTIGKLLSSKLSFQFIDSDKIIENLYGNTQQIINLQGNERFKAIEEEVLLSIEFDNTILSTGGSAIFSLPAMEYLKESSEIIYLDVPLEIISNRIGNFCGRGFIKNSKQSFRDAYDERESLYRKYANHIVENTDEVDECVEKIILLLDL